MRLPVRFAGPMALLLTTGVASLLAQQAPELAGGGLAQAPPGITRIDSAAAPHTTDAAPQPLGFEDEVSCFGYIGPESEQFIAAGHRGRERSRAGGLHRTQPPVPRRRIRPRAQAGRRVLDRDAGRRSSTTPSRAASMGRFYQYRGRAVRRLHRGPDGDRPGDPRLHRHPDGVLPEALRARADSARPPAAVRGHLRPVDRQGPWADRDDAGTASWRSGRAPTS